MEPNTQRIQAVSFDVGGTLIAPWPSVGDVYASVAARFGVKPLSPSILAQTFRAAWKQKKDFNYSRTAWQGLVEETFGESLPRHLAGEVFGAIYEQFARPESWRIYEDVVPALTGLRNRGYRLAILSNWDERLRPLLETLRLRSWFEVVVISCEVGVAKPGSGIFCAAARSLDLAPEQILHVGDGRLEDYEGARAAGWAGVHLRRGAEDQISQWPTLASLVDLLSVLEKSS